MSIPTSSAHFQDSDDHLPASQQNEAFSRARSHKQRPLQENNSRQTNCLMLRRLSRMRTNWKFRDILVHQLPIGYSSRYMNSRNLNQVLDIAQINRNLEAIYGSPQPFPIQKNALVSLTLMDR